MIKIVYPEKREVSPSQLLGWYIDAVENGEVEGSVNDEEIDIETAALALEDAGLISLASGQYPLAESHYQSLVE